jgi:hypothetical protein
MVMSMHSTPGDRIGVHENCSNIEQAAEEMVRIYEEIAR